MKRHPSQLALPVRTHARIPVVLMLPGWSRGGVLSLCHLCCCCSLCLIPKQERSGTGREAMCTKPDGCRHVVCHQSKPNKTTAEIIRQRPEGSGVPEEATTLLIHVSDRLLTATSISPAPQHLACLPSTKHCLSLPPTQESEACAKGFAINSLSLQIWSLPDFMLIPSIGTQHWPQNSTTTIDQHEPNFNDLNNHFCEFCNSNKNKSITHRKHQQLGM